MKKLTLCTLLGFLVAAVCSDAQPVGIQRVGAQHVNADDDSDKKPDCKCYCSVSCAPRQVDWLRDKPRCNNGICFCNDLDRDEYNSGTTCAGAKKPDPAELDCYDCDKKEAQEA